jgi:hypothetical protein
LADSIRDEARRAYKRGWALIPLKYGEKAPDLPTGHGLLERRATADELRSFTWEGLGIVTGGLSNIVVLDVDDKAGGTDTLAERGWGDFVTPYVNTPGGKHFYFNYDERLSKTLIGTLGPGLDLKSNGGYVVSPPSVHPSGDTYEWVVTPEELAIQDAPQWLLDEVSGEARSATRDTGPDNMSLFEEVVAEGNRNETMTHMAGIFHWDRLPKSWCLTAMLAINERYFDPPLPEEEVLQVARNILNRPQRNV